MLMNIVWTVGTVLCIAGLIIGACLTLMEAVIGAFARKLPATLARENLLLVESDGPASVLNADRVGERPVLIGTQTPELIAENKNILAA